VWTLARSGCGAHQNGGGSEVLRLAYRFSRNVLERSIGRSARYRRLLQYVERQIMSEKGSLNSERFKRLGDGSVAASLSPVQVPGVTVSVVVNTLNRAPLLRRLLSALEQVRYRPFEVIVVEGPSTDDTAAVLDAWTGRLKRVKCSEANLSVSRNIGLEVASGEIVAFIDDDAVPEPDWLDRLLEPMTDPRVAAAGGPIRDSSGIHFQCRALASNHLAEVQQIEEDWISTNCDRSWCLTLTGTNFCVRRKAALAIGGFDEAYAYFLEETDLQRRLHDAGYLLAYSQSAEVHHGFAASAIRDSSRIPSDFKIVVASLVYFCLKYDRGQDLHTVSARITERLLQIRQQIDRLQIWGRIDAEKAKVLWQSALIGVRAGTRLSPSFGHKRFANAAVWPFLPFLNQEREVKSAFRLAVVASDGIGPSTARALERLAHTFVSQGQEVTLVSSHDVRSHVEFVQSHWRHMVRLPRNGVVPSLSTNGSIPTEIRRELQRIESRRLFDFVLVAEPANGGCSLTLHPYGRLPQADTTAPVANMHLRIGATALREIPELADRTIHEMRNHLGMIGRYWSQGGQIFGTGNS
jgi:GT2 family glycosyltransferase